MKKTLVSCISVVMCGLFLFCSCAQTKYELKLFALGDDVSIHTTEQAAYLAQQDYTKISANGLSESSRPNAVHFEWEAIATAENAPAIEEYVLQISSNDDFSTCLTYRTTESSYDVYNLCVATEYIWRVTAKFENGSKSVSNVSTFATEAIAPRNLYIDGITNIRDLGGWETSSGGRVKQGMIYRCGRLNKSEQTTVEIEITQLGIDAMRNELNICSEIDVRMPNAHNTETGGITSSPLGDDITYFNAPIEWNVSNILTGNKQAVIDVFAFLAKEENYPVIYHCNIGTDRTGLFAYLINGLMGVSEEDLYRDYLFSNFGKINGTRTLSGIQNSYVKTIKSYAGDTLAEKIENCLVDIGVASADIQAIRDILTV